MHPRLHKLLDYLENVVRLDRQAEMDDLYQRALRWEPVERLPITLSYPLPQSPRFP